MGSHGPRDAAGWQVAVRIWASAPRHASSPATHVQTCSGPTLRWSPLRLLRRTPVQVATPAPSPLTRMALSVQKLEDERDTDVVRSGFCSTPWSRHRGVGQLGQTWTLELPDLLAQVVTRRSSKDTCRWCRWVPVIVPRYHAGRDPAAPNALRLAVYEPRSSPFRAI